MGNYGTIIYLVAMVAIFYFLIIRPQQQRQKNHQQTIASLQPKSRVTTAGGILGKVVSVKDDVVVVNIAENVNIEIVKSSIAKIND